MTSPSEKPGKTPEAKRTLAELDKIQKGLEELHKEVDLQKLKSDIEMGSDVEFRDAIEPIKKKWDVDWEEIVERNPELKKLNKKEQLNIKNGIWRKMEFEIKKSILFKTEEFKKIPEFTNELENLPRLKKLIDEAKESKNPAEKVKNFFKKIAKKLGTSAAFVGTLLLGWAADIKKEKKGGTITSRIFEKLAGWFGAEVPGEKIATLKKETKELMKEKKWDEAETKANEILEIDENNKFAQRTLKNIEKKKTKGETAETTEFKYEKEFVNLKDMLSLSSVPFVLTKEKYEAVLKEKGNDPKRLKTALQTSMKKPNGPLALIYKEVMIIRSLNKGKFKFQLSDISLTPDQAKDIADALDKKDGRRLELDLKKLTPPKFREFVEAVKKGNTADYIKKAKPPTEKKPPEVAEFSIFGIPIKPPPKK